MFSPLKQSRWIRLTHLSVASFLTITSILLAEEGAPAPSSTPSSAEQEIKAAPTPVAEAPGKSGLESGTLRSGGSGVGKFAQIEQKIAGSQIFSTTMKVEKGTAADFALSGLLGLEKVVSDFNRAKGPDAKRQETKIRQTVSSLLDLNSLAEGALATYWDEFGKKKNPTVKDREKYRKLFKELVEENYLDKARQYVGGKYQIVLTEEKSARSGSGKLVIGRIKKTDVDVVVEFLVKKGKDSAFHISDVKLDETSLEATYRGSFNTIVKKKGSFKAGFPELMKAMDKRLKELRKGKTSNL